MQVKILRVLQEKTFEPVGGEVTRKVDVRVISASNKNLAEMVKKGTFREDLYYRLAVVPIELPPLRERRNDIKLLADHFLKSVSEKLGRPGMQFSVEALSLLMSYAWPGNIRQLQNAMQYSMIKCHDNTVLPEHLPPELTGGFGLDDSFGTTTAVVVIGYVIGRLLEGAFILLFQIETHCWRPIDSLFRTVTARRNPNMILLTVGTLAGRPDLGLVMVAIWTVAGFVCAGSYVWIIGTFLMVFLD